MNASTEIREFSSTSNYVALSAITFHSYLTIHHIFPPFTRRKELLLFRAQNLTLHFDGKH